MSRSVRATLRALALLSVLLGLAPLSAQLPGDECTTAFPISDGLIGFDTTPMTQSADPFTTAQCPGTGFGGMHRDLWFQYIASSTGSLVLSTCGLTVWDTELVVYTGSCGVLTQIACNGDGALPACPNFSSNLAVPVTGGTLLWIRLGGYSASAFGPGTIQVQVLPSQFGDECSTALIAFDGTNSLDTQGFSLSPDPFDPSQCSGTGLGGLRRDGWWRYTASATGNVTISLCGQVTVNSDLVVYSGSCGGLVQIGCNGDACGTASAVTVGVTAGEEIHIRIGSTGSGGALGMVGTFAIQGAIPAAPGDECGTALLAFDGVNPFDTTVHTDSADPYDDAQCTGTFLGAMTRDGWWRYTPSTSGEMTLSLCGLSGLDSDLVVYTGSCGALTQISCNGDSCVLVSELVVPVVAGVQYTIRLGSWAGVDPGAIGAFSIAVTPPAGAPFRRGDADGDGCVDALLDTTHIFRFLFPSGGPPATIDCLEAADANDDGMINSADGIALLQWGFPSGPPIPLPAPGPSICGPDPTPSSLGCASYSCAPCGSLPIDPDVTLSLAPADSPSSLLPVRVRLDSAAPISSLSIGVCHPGALVQVVSVQEGPDLAVLAGGSGPDVFAVTIYPGLGWTAGVIVDLFGMDAIPPEIDASIVIATYSCSGAVTAQLDFCSGLGSPNFALGVGWADGTSGTPTTIDATIGCGPPPAGSFMRGDSSGDGVLDATDAAVLENFLFPGVLGFGPPPPPAGCDLVPSESGDLNDNEVYTIADVLLFLEYLDCGPISIPGPSTLCGDDVDDDPVGFDVIDDDYLLSAFTFSVTGPPDGIRDVDVLLQVLSPTPVKAVSFSLVIGNALTLAPVPYTPVVGGPFIYTGSLIDGNFVLFAAGSRECGVAMLPASPAAFQPVAMLHLKLAPNAVFPPCELVQEATIEGEIRRTTVVDPFFQDHQPRFISASGGVIFARGDANQDGNIDIGDPITILAHLFGPPGPDLDCDDAGDAQNDGNVDIGDAIYMLDYSISMTGPPPPYPFPECGYDLDLDGLNCLDPNCP